jgi:hypothetical protein
MELEKKLAEHVLVAELKRRGVSETQMSQSRFLGEPFELGVFTCPADVPRKDLGLIEAFCALRWLLLDSPMAPESEERAWRLVSDAYGGLMTDRAEKTTDQRKENQKKAVAEATKYSPEARAAWQQIADEPALAKMSKSSKAELIAKRLDLDRKAISTIRRSIK